MATHFTHKSGGGIARAAASFLCLALTLSAAPARADWLVGRDGSRVETKGPWTVKGKLVVFTLANSSLGSLQLADVDLDASTRATSEAAAKAAAAATGGPAAEAAGKAPVMVLTDANVAHVTEEPAAAAGDKPAENVPAQPAAQMVQVGPWDHTFRSADNSVQIEGTVKNTSKSLAGAVALTVMLYDEKGGLLASGPASLPTDTLPAGATTTFSVNFPGIQNFSMVKFDVQSLEIKTRADEEAPQSPTI